MRIVEKYSHLNGLEYLLVHKKHIWKEIENVIENVDASILKTKISKEKTKKGIKLYNPKELNSSFKILLEQNNWQESRVKYWVTKNIKLIRSTLDLEPEEQHEEIINSGETAILSYNQTDFIKERVALEIQFGKYSFVAYDLFVKHLAFYVRDQIDVGIEILPMKKMQSQMSSGPGYYEGELYNVLRNGRGVPAVPLVLIGIDE